MRFLEAKGLGIRVQMRVREALYPLVGLSLGVLGIVEECRQFSTGTRPSNSES